MGKNVPLLVFIILAHIFLIFNAPLAFGAFSEIAEKLLILYLITMTAISGLFDVKPKTLSIGILGFQTFAIGFIASSVVLLLISPLFTSQIAGSISLFQAASFGFLYAFVIALDEEIIFRDLIPKGLGVPDLFAQPLFGLFHAATLTAILNKKIELGLLPASSFLPSLVLGFVVLTALGFIWAFIRDRSDIYASAGSHFAYNLFTYGVLFTLIGIGV